MNIDLDAVDGVALFDAVRVARSDITIDGHIDDFEGFFWCLFRGFVSDTVGARLSGYTGDITFIFEGTKVADNGVGTVKSKVIANLANDLGSTQELVEQELTQ